MLGSAPSYLAKPRLSLKDVRTRIKALRRINLRVTELDAIKSDLPQLLHHYVHPSPLVQPGERIFRAVFSSARPTNKTQLIYPPPDKVGYGRCNRPGEAVFYGSVGSIAAMREIAPAHGAHLVLSMWRVTRPLFAASIGYTRRTFDRLRSQRWTDVWWRQTVPREIDPPAFETSENQLIDRFLAKEFTKQVRKGEEWDYKLSVAISEAFLKAQPVDHRASNSQAPNLLSPGETLLGMEVAGLVYPSIAALADSDNVALKTHIADTSLAFAWAHYIEISRPTGRSDEFAPNGLDFATQLAPNGDIQWFGEFPNTHAAGTDFHLDVDGSALVLKDSTGRTAGMFAETASQVPKCLLARLVARTLLHL